MGHTPTKDALKLHNTNRAYWKVLSIHIMNSSNTSKYLTGRFSIFIESFNGHGIVDGT